MKQIPSLIKYALVFGIVLLIFLMWNGVRNSKLIANYSKALHKTIGVLDKVAEKARYDSTVAAEQYQQQQDTIAFLKGQYSLVTTMNMVTTDSLFAANKRITNLLSKHVPIKPSLDTSVTTVPNEYLEECAGCFAELKNGQQLVIKYKSEKEGSDRILNSIITAKDNQLSILKDQNKNLKESFDDAVAIAKNNEKKLEPRRTVFLSLSAISIGSAVPSGVGGGFLYMDKRTRIFGLNYYISNQGPVYQAQLAMPLSFKCK